jgi:rare lipoprotein A
MALRLKVADQLDWLAPFLAVFNEGGVSRLQAGPYASRAEAETVLPLVRAVLQLAPIIVERR